MKIIDLIRLLARHFVLLLVAPVLLAGMVIYLTRTPSYTYSSETILYTGIASGSSVEMDKAFSFFANNTAFDNLINVITSRKTQQDVAIRLLAQHLMMPKSEARYISKESYKELMRITPDYVKALVVKSGNNGETYSANTSQNTSTQAETEEFITHAVQAKETLYSISKQYGITLDQLRRLNNLFDNNIEIGQILRIEKVTDTEAADEEMVSAVVDSTASDSLSAQLLNDTTESFSFSDFTAADKSRTLPQYIDRDAYEQTIRNLENYMASSDTNFVYRLLNFSHPHYSIKAISSVKVQRIASSDLVRIKFESNDPGICQQTLAMLTEVCIKNYKLIKENRSDAVVKYFEYQLAQAAIRLKIGEDKLLAFNEDNNIINYYEQSKAVAIVKEDLEVDYNNMRIKLAGYKAAIQRIEEKLGNQQQMQLKSASILEKRNELSALNLKIATAEAMGNTGGKEDNNLVKLKVAADKLKEELRNSVSELYSYRNSTEGLPVTSLLNDWLVNVLNYEDTKAGLEVMSDRIAEFQKQYSIYAPAGANIKRIEREISVSEQEYLEILHGLNMAKLKLQDAELSATIKAVDPPFFPLSPNPTKRKLLIIAGALVGFLIVLSSILATEYFDETLRNPEHATKKIQHKTIGVFPKVYLKTGSLNFTFIANRLLEMIIQQVNLITDARVKAGQPRTILVMSSLSDEGKSVIAGNIACKLKKQGRKVLYLNFSEESLRQLQNKQIGQHPHDDQDETPEFGRTRKRPDLFSILLGYGDKRLDTESPFLDHPKAYLDSNEYYQYQMDENFLTANSYRDLMQGSSGQYIFGLDYVILEIPSFLHNSFPAPLLASFDLAVLVCRANRIWTKADEGALDLINKTALIEPVILLNGVELPVVETVLGTLPKKRSRIRRIIKKIFTLQFRDRYEL